MRLVFRQLLELASRRLEQHPLVVLPLLSAV